MEGNYTLYEFTTVEIQATDYQFQATDIPKETESKLKVSNISATISVIGYTVIFLLSIIGNSLVIVTLIQNKRMRSVTNVFLLSLSISDILFVVFCLPFTLVGILLHNFIFGPVICKFIPYMQSVTVAISIWTMVAIALERYHAICNPLASRAWQTKTRAYKIIALTWVAAFLLFFPTVIVTQLTQLDTAGTKVKCRETFKDKPREQTYRAFQFTVLLVIPFFALAISYGLIVLELWRGMRFEYQDAREEKEKNGTPLKEFSKTVTSASMGADSNANDPMLRTHGQAHHIYRPEKHSRSVNVPRSTSSNEAKKRVVRMLIVLVVLFFAAWTPTWVINIWYLIHSDSAVKFSMEHPLLVCLIAVMCLVCVYDLVMVFLPFSPFLVSTRPFSLHRRHIMTMYLFWCGQSDEKELLFFRLISYSSACVNPIVYCFMNKKFRKGFLEAFSCCCKQEWYPVPGVPTDHSRKVDNRTSHMVSTTNYTDVSTGDDD